MGLDVVKFYYLTQSQQSYCSKIRTCAGQYSIDHGQSPVFPSLFDLRYINCSRKTECCAKYLNAFQYEENNREIKVVGWFLPPRQ